ncbi:MULTISPECIES: hypothetical protein [Achromobacter]|uniref:hypothetical protein n=1 Tax=Achromobacter TaxID=222 RepID=UPI00257EFB94|nr:MULTISPECIES: hypothetical protein [Achromobacter]
MNKKLVSAFLFAALCAAGAAQAQNVAPGATQEMQFPSAQGSLSPPSTLRMTVTPEAPPPAPIRDTPQSQAEFQRCRTVSDRAATSNAQMQAGVEQCLRELEQRRQQQ